MSTQCWQPAFERCLRDRRSVLEIVRSWWHPAFSQPTYTGRRRHKPEGWSVVALAGYTGEIPNDFLSPASTITVRQSNPCIFLNLKGYRGFESLSLSANSDPLLSTTSTTCSDSWLRRAMPRSPLCEATPLTHSCRRRFVASSGWIWACSERQLAGDDWIQCTETSLPLNSFQASGSRSRWAGQHDRLIPFGWSRGRDPTDAL